MTFRVILDMDNIAYEIRIIMRIHSITITFFSESIVLYIL